MKYTLITLTLVLAIIINPLHSVQSATDNTALINQLLAQIVILQAELAKLTGTTPTCTFTRTLREGTEGTDVTCLQTYLKSKGHFTGTPTGFYGPLTKAAVYTWQQRVGIIPEPTAIGMFGPRSQETLLKEMRSTVVVTNTGITPSTNTTPKTDTKKRGGGGVQTRNPDDSTKITTPTTTPKITTVPVVNTPVTQSKGNTTIPAPTVAGANWNTLCAQSGIFVCDNFSDRHTGTIAAGFSKAYIENGTLVFTIPSNSNANAGGEYRQNFSPIGEGKFVAFSYRIKADAAALNIQSPGRKEFIMWRGSSSCTDLQLVQTHNGSKPVLVPYTDCGARGFTSKIPNSGGDIQWHYPDFDCKYHAVKNGDYTGCAISHADQWENFYVEVQVGNYRQPNSSVTMWYRPDNGAWKRYIATSTYAFNGTGGFEHFMLTVYMTGKDTSIAHPEGKVYYDHLIMATKPFNADQFIAATVNPVTNAASNQSVPVSTPPPTIPTPVNSTPTTTVPVTPTGPRTVHVSVPALPAPSPNPAASLASQVSAIPSGTWAKITDDNKATDIDPGKDSAINRNYPSNAPWHGGSGYKGMFEAWNSGGLATSLGPCGSILYYGGGHNDYWGNQVVALNLCGGVKGGPVWQRLSNPYKETIVWPATDGAFPDGTPSPAHTYDTLSVGNNKLMVFNAQSTNAPTHVPSAFIFDIANRTWTGPITHLGNSHGGSAWDSKRSLVWNMPSYTTSGGKFSSFSPTTQVFTNYFKTNVSPFVSNTDSMMSYDPDNDKLVVTNFRSSGASIAEIDPANPDLRPVIVSQIGKPDTDQGQHAFSWSSKRRAFIVWMDLLNDGKVWEVKRTGLNASGTPEYTWTLLTDLTNTVQPVTTSHNGSYDKFQVVTIGNEEVLIGQLRLQDGIYAFKIPAPGVTTIPRAVPLTSSQTKIDTLQNLLNQLKALQLELNKRKH